MSLADGVDQPLVQQRLVEFAIRGIPGAEHASMTLIEGNQPPRTNASSDALPYQWDHMQYQYGEGPCLDAITTNGVEMASDLRTESRSPLFARAAVDQTPARSMLSFPALRDGGEPRRAEPVRNPTRRFHQPIHRHRFHLRCVRLHGVARRARHDKANHLTRALDNGQLTSQQAFDQMRTASQNVNRKLRDIAAAVTLTGTLPKFSLKVVRPSPP